jgi:hypothetical protein
MGTVLDPSDNKLRKAARFIQTPWATRGVLALNGRMDLPDDSTNHMPSPSLGRPSSAADHLHKCADETRD